MTDAIILNRARRNLSEWIMNMALAMSSKVGFGWIAVDAGHPESFGALLAEKRSCMGHATPARFRVWAGGSDGTIYTTPEVNHAFRFWHDMLHIECSYTMSFEHEVQLGLYQAKLCADKFGKGSTEYKLFVVDTVGQSLHHELTGEFVRHQLVFAKRSLELHQ